MSRKHTIKHIKNKTVEISKGYECLSKKYVNAHTKLEFRCDRGHIFQTTWSNFQQGTRCHICSGFYIKKRKTIEEIRKYVEQFGYKCLSKEYKNANTKLKFSCNKGHIFEATWGSFQHGQRCLTCFRENYCGKNCYNWKNYSKKELQELENYRTNVRQITNQNFSKYYYLINPNGLLRSYEDYHIDHIYTIIDGFRNNIPPEVIASPINLQMLTAKENMSKNGRSDMTKEVLYELYYQFEQEVISL